MRIELSMWTSELPHTGVQHELTDVPDLLAKDGADYTTRNEWRDIHNIDVVRQDSGYGIMGSRI